MSASVFWRTVLDWVPFFIFISLLIYFMRKVAKAQPDAAKRLNDHRERQMDEMRRLNTNLERIAAALEAQRAVPASGSIERRTDVGA